MTALERKATRLGIAPPGAGTLRRYGLTREDWLALLAAQGWKCPICHKRNDVRWVTDHDHVPMWRHMPPERRRRYVRGILCSYDNHRRVNSRMSAAEAARIARYLRAYEARRDA